MRLPMHWSESEKRRNWRNSPERNFRVHDVDLRFRLKVSSTFSRRFIFPLAWGAMTSVNQPAPRTFTGDKGHFMRRRSFQEKCHGCWDERDEVGLVWNVFFFILLPMLLADISASQLRRGFMLNDISAATVELVESHPPPPHRADVASCVVIR